MSTTSKKTIEQRTAEAVLQKPKGVTVGGRRYTIAPPSIATLILASEAVSHLPALCMDGGAVVEEVLRNAKDCAAIGELTASLLLGAKRIREERHRRRTLRDILCGRRRVTEQEALARELLEDLSPRDLYKLLTECLVEMQLQDFFGLTTFLTEINLTRPTKKVVTGTTAFGQ